MALDPTSVKIVTDWLSQKCPNLTCPACGARRWELGDLDVGFAAPGHKPGPVAINPSFGQNSGGFTSQIPVVCSDCAYIAYFAAPLMGVITS